MLHRGGNAVDAGVAATFAGSVIEFSHFAFGGEVPVLIKLAGKPVVTINGQGNAPQLATREFFEKRAAGSGQNQQAVRGQTQGLIPSTGPLAATVPGVLDAMIVALDKFGTMKLADVLQPAIELAEAFPIDELRVQYIHNTRSVFEQWPDAKAIFLPNARNRRSATSSCKRIWPIRCGNWSRSKNVTPNVGAAPPCKPRAIISIAGRWANAIVTRLKRRVACCARVTWPRSKLRSKSRPKVTYRGYEVYNTGFWAQGPVLLQSLNLIEGFDLKALKHNSPAYIHTLVESLKLAFADRDRYYGDPHFVKVPGAELLSKDYAALRRTLVDANTGFAGTASR
jgi:gamma-glutamyltranspeptidase/glutathione hydrolase